MDESWRMRMGMPFSGAAASSTTRNTFSRNRFTEEISHRKTSDNPLLEAEDFNDVFGGPPRTVISRQFSGNENFVFPGPSSSSFFSDDVFQPKENMGSPFLPERGRRSLPEFQGPAERGAWRSDQFEGFYGDIFGWKEEEAKRSRSRSGSKSKAGSSWVVSSEDLSPSQPAVGAGVFGEDDIALLASKLRSISVSRRWHSNEPIEEEIHEESHSQGMPISSSNYTSSTLEYESIDIKTSNHGFRRRNPSPEDTKSPSSVVSSLWKDHKAQMYGINQSELLQERDAKQEEVEVMRSYVIEINGNQCREEKDEAIGVEEAIAWAKEKYQTHCSAAEEPFTNQFSRNANEYTYATDQDRESDNCSNAEDKQHMDNNMEMELELLNEKMRLWSSGKESDIRFLLLTLHQILWQESRWVPVPKTSLIESHQVKKVYQRARLLLHPDKLQQNGATYLQRCIADKAFPILQDAWAVFLSQDDINK